MGSLSRSLHQLSTYQGTSHMSWMIFGSMKQGGVCSSLRNLALFIALSEITHTASGGLPLGGCLCVWLGSDPSSGGSGVVCSPGMPVVLGTRLVLPTPVPREQALLVIGVSGPEPSRSGSTGG